MLRRRRQGAESSRFRIHVQAFAPALRKECLASGTGLDLMSPMNTSMTRANTLLPRLGGLRLRGLLP